MEKEKLDRFKLILERLIEEIEASLSAGRDMTAVVSLDESIGRLSRVDALPETPLCVECSA